MSQLIRREGILLRVDEAQDGGRKLFLFTKEEGPMKLTLPRTVMNRYGTGLILPFSKMYFTFATKDGKSVITQYEGNLLFDIMTLTYEEICQWFYVVELCHVLFPLGMQDIPTFERLKQIGTAARTRNRKVVAFAASVQLLALGGFDPCTAQPLDDLSASGSTRTLLHSFRDYGWEKPFPEKITKTRFEAAAKYLDMFIEKYADIEIKMKGAFLQ